MTQTAIIEKSDGAFNDAYLHRLSAESLPWIDCDDV